MDTFPPLPEQLLWIAVLSILSWIALKLIRSKGLLKISDAQVCDVGLKDLVWNFVVYIVALVVIAPLLFGWFLKLQLATALVTAALFQFIFMSLVAGFLISYIKGNKITLIKRPESFLDLALKVIFYLLVIFPIVSLIGQLCDTFLYVFFDVKGYEQLAVKFLKQTLDSPVALISTVIAITVLAPITEEILFRGYLLNFFKNRFGSWFGVVISGILFALFHYSPSQGLGNLSLLCALSFFGIMLGAFYLKTKNLLYPMTLHAIFNTLSCLRILFFDA